MSTSTLENEPFESREARTFFSPLPRKILPRGMRDHVRANLKSSWAKFHVSQGTRRGFTLIAIYYAK